MGRAEVTGDGAGRGGGRGPGRERGQAGDNTHTGGDRPSVGPCCHHHHHITSTTRPTYHHQSPPPVPPPPPVTPPPNPRPFSLLIDISLFQCTATGVLTIVKPRASLKKKVCFLSSGWPKLWPVGRPQNLFFSPFFFFFGKKMVKF